MRWRLPLNTFQSRNPCCGNASCGKAERAPRAWGSSWRGQNGTTLSSIKSRVRYTVSSKTWHKPHTPRPDLAQTMLHSSSLSLSQLSTRLLSSESTEPSVSVCDPSSESDSRLCFLKISVSSNWDNFKPLGKYAVRHASRMASSVMAAKARTTQFATSLRDGWGTGP